MSKCESQARYIFQKFIGDNAKEIEEKIKFFWAVDKCNKQNGGKFNKHILTRFVEFQGSFSFDNIVMIIFKGDKVKGFPVENLTAVKPFNASSTGDDYLVVKL